MENPACSDLPVVVFSQYVMLRRAPDLEEP